MTAVTDGPGARTVVENVIAVIPAWEARQRIGETVDALRSQVDDCIVVDNGSEDGTAGWLRRHRPRVDVIGLEVNRGFSVAVNAGCDRALARGARAVLLVNDDALVGGGAISAMVAALEDDRRIGATTAHIVYRDRPGVLQSTGGVFDPDRALAVARGDGQPDRGQYAGRPWVDFPSGAACLLRAEALLDVGPWDEGYYLYGEDADWGIRARDAGWAIRYVPEARVLHAGATGTAADPARRRYYVVRNRLRLAARHGTPSGRLRARRDTGRLMAKQPLRWLWPSRRRDALAVLLAVADHVRHRDGRSRHFG